MIIDVPFVYDAVVLMGRKRNTDDVRVRDVLPVKIEEVTSLDAPLVGTVPAPHRPWHAAEPIHVELRSFNGRLWRQPLVVLEKNGPEVAPVSDDLIRMTIERTDTSSFPIPWSVGWTWDKAHESIDIPGLRHVVTSTRAEVVAQILKRAEGYLVIDGHFFVESREPVLELKFEVSGTTGAVEPLIVTHFTGDILHERFRADRADELLAEGEARYGNMAPDVRARKLAAAPLITSPDLLTFDDETYAIEYASRRFVESMHPFLVTGSRDFLMAFVTARDGLTDGLQAGSVPDVIDALLAAANIMESHRIGEWEIRTFREATERWNVSRARLNADEFALDLSGGFTA